MQSRIHIIRLAWTVKKKIEQCKVVCEVDDFIKKVKVVDWTYDLPHLDNFFKSTPNW